MTSANGSSREDVLIRMAPWLIVAAGIAAYLNVFGCPFIFDDALVAAYQPGQIRLSLAWLNPRALVSFTFLLNAVADGLNPAGYHAMNLAIHVAAGLLLYGIVRRTLSRLAIPGWTPALACGVATISAALWVVHPLQTESVAYVCQRFESLMGLMMFFTLYGFVRSLDSRRPIVWLSVSVASCWLGMATKEVMVMAPVMVALYDHTLVSKGWRAMSCRWRYYGLLVASLVFLYLLRHHAVARAHAGAYAMAYPTVSRWVYLMTQSEVILHYLRLAIWPTGLCIDYAWLPVESLRVVLVPVGILAGLIGLTVVGVWRRRPGGYLGAWFFLLLAPSSSVVPLHDLAFEHRMYLPLAAVVVLIVAGGAHLLVRVGQEGLQRRVFLRIGAVLAASCLVILTVATLTRNRTYASAETMWRDVIRKAPHNLRQKVALASNLNQQGRCGEAELLARDVVERLKAARQVESRPRHPMAATDPAVLYPEALQQLGLSLIGRGQTQEAIDCLREGLRLVQTRRLHHNLGLALLQDNQVDEAIRELDAAISLDPSSALSWAFKAELLSQAGRLQESALAFERAIACDAGLLTAKLDLAWLLATCPDDRVRNGERAANLAHEVVAGGGSVWGLDVLAAAYAETGRFREAIQAVQKALDLESKADPAGQGAMSAGLRQHRAAYEEGRPWRESSQSTKE